MCILADGHSSCLQVQLIQSRPGMSLPELQETYAALQAQHREEFLMYNLTAAALSQVSCHHWIVDLAQVFPLGAAALTQAPQVFWADALAQVTRGLAEVLSTSMAHEVHPQHGMAGWGC